MPRGGFALAARHTLWVVIVPVDLSQSETGSANGHDHTWCQDDDGSDPGVLKLDHLSPEVSRQVVARLMSKDFSAWNDALARVGNCVRPVRLRGTSERIDAATGEVLSSFSSADHPLEVVHVRCGNRRASECPSCSRLYAADMFHLIRAGVTGEKTVPESVAAHPLLFATLTAPSFGRVHTSGRCHPGDRARRCPHGRTTACGVVHADGVEGRRSAALLGQPLCPDCYDYASHVVWQWFAPDLWRRFAIALHRSLAHHLGVPAAGLAEVATVQYAKVAEFQRRGAVHFHALIRLDGPRTSTGVSDPPAAVTAERLAGLVTEAASSVQLHVPAVDDSDVTRRLVFGRQFDVRVVRSHRPDDDQALTAAQVAGYLATLGHLPLSLITAGLVDRAIDRWELEYGRSTVKNTVSALVLVLDEAVRDGLLTRNPPRTGLVGGPSGAPSRRSRAPHATWRCPDVATLQRLVTAVIEAGHHQAWGDVVTLSATRALRISEVAGPVVGDVDLDRGLLQVARQTYPGRGGLVTKETKGRRRGFRSSNPCASRWYGCQRAGSPTSGC